MGYSAEKTNTKNDPVIFNPGEIVNNFFHQDFFMSKLLFIFTYNKLTITYYGKINKSKHIWNKFPQFSY